MKYSINYIIIVRYLILILTFFTFSCSSKMNISQFKDSKPEFILEDYFEGSVIAWGLFHDRFGNLRRQFKVDIEGTLADNQLTLDEKFVYDDGEKQQRIWTIDILDGKKYVGRADDVIGSATGSASGNALNWSYDLLLKIKDSTIKVRFDDWMFLQEKGVLINRAEVKKFGITLGVVSITFLKL